MSQEIRPAPTCYSKSPASGLRCTAIHQGTMESHYHEHANGSWTLWDDLVEYFKTPDEVEAMAVKVMAPEGIVTHVEQPAPPLQHVLERVPEKPLHVKVAEALGFTAVPPHDGEFHPETWSVAEDTTFDTTRCRTCNRAIPRYDTDWAATGPLIEKYGLDIAHIGEPNSGQWSVTRNGLNEDGSVSDTWYREDLLLHAICTLIVRQHKWGLL